MPMLDNELKFYKSLTVSDAAANGGRMSSNQIISAALENLFSGIGQAERTAGSTKYRKIFAKVASGDNLEGKNSKIFLDKNTEGADHMVFFPATQNDTQAAITGAERVYGGGKLNASVLAAVTSVVVLIEDSTAIPFVIGDTVRITNKTDINDLVGTEELVVLSGVSNVGTLVTLNFAPGLANEYLESNSRVMSLYAAGDLKPTVDNFVVTTAGDGDYAQNQIAPNFIGAVEQVWTVEFTSPLNFNITGDTLGLVGTGTIGAGASPNNPNFGEPYFELQPGGFSGTFADNDTIVFHTHPAAAPLWVRRKVPAGAGVIASSTGRFVLRVESVE